MKRLAAVAGTVAILATGCGSGGDTEIWCSIRHGDTIAAANAVTSDIYRYIPRTEC